MYESSRFCIHQCNSVRIILNDSQQIKNIASNTSSIMNETGRNTEGRGHGLIEVTMLIFSESWRKTASDMWGRSGSQLRFELAASLMQQVLPTESTCLVIPIPHVPRSTNLFTRPQFSSKLSTHLLRHLPKGILTKILSPILPEGDDIYNKPAE
jgi:hypothetical protein